MRVLITGATGLVGTELAQALFRAGHDVVVVSRDVEKARKHFGIPVEAHAWNAPYEDFPSPAVAGVEAVFNLVGENVASGRWTNDLKKRIHDSRVVATRKLSEALKRQKLTLKVFIGVSAVGVYGDRGDEILTESSEPGHGFLSDVCRDWENESRQVPAERSAILRLGVVLSSQGGLLQRLLSIFSKGLGGPVGNGKQWVPWIHIQDLVGLMVDSLTDDSITGTLNATSAAPVTNREMGATLAEILNKPFGLPAPAFALKLAMGEMASIALDSLRVVGKPQITKPFRFPALREALEELLRGPKDQMTQFEANQWVNRPIDEVFLFFSDAKKLELLTPPWMFFRVVAMNTPQIGEGTLIDYKLQIKKVPTRWRSRIEEWTPPKKFVDTQVIGPYRHWHHTHTFESVRGGTWLRDVVRYQIPLGVAGKALLGGMIRKDVDTIFSFRRAKIRELFP